MRAPAAIPTLQETVKEGGAEELFCCEARHSHCGDSVPTIPGRDEHSVLQLVRAAHS